MYFSVFLCIFQCFFIVVLCCFIVCVFQWFCVFFSFFICFCVVLLFLCCFILLFPFLFCVLCNHFSISTQKCASTASHLITHYHLQIWIWSHQQETEMKQIIIFFAVSLTVFYYSQHKTKNITEQLFLNKTQHNNHL